MNDDKRRWYDDPMHAIGCWEHYNSMCRWIYLREKKSKSIYCKGSILGEVVWLVLGDLTGYCRRHIFKHIPGVSLSNWKVIQSHTWPYGLVVLTHNVTEWWKVEAATRVKILNGQYVRTQEQLFWRIWAWGRLGLRGYQACFFASMIFFFFLCS